jgi:hypothetical protein
LPSVTLEGVDAEHTVKGFILQARRACRLNEDNQRVGRFLGTSNDWKFQCPNDPTSITHTYKDAKQTLTMDWVMTESVAEEVQFMLVLYTCELIECECVQRNNSGRVQHILGEGNTIDTRASLWRASTTV